MAERKNSPPAAGAKKKTATPKQTAATTAKRKNPSAKSTSGDHGSQDDSLYSDPGLRSRLKERIQAGTKGGRAGQWSARKSQLLAHEYEAQGGGYTGKKRSGSQQDLRKWTKEEWTTASGEKAVQGKETARYLPKKAWDELSPAEKKATDAKKRTASRQGKQTVANTAAAKTARRKATTKKASAKKD